jgi:hypothetical protein
MPEKSGATTTSNRWKELTEIIKSLPPRDRLLGLIVLVIEGALTGLSFTLGGMNQLVALCGMIAILLAIVLVVSLSYLKSNLKSTQPAVKQLLDFYRSIEGTWWSRSEAVDSVTLGVVVMRVDTLTNSLTAAGDSYDSSGKPEAHWEILTSCARPSEKKILYYWEGWHRANPNTRWAGIGELTFSELGGSGKRMMRGTGRYLDAPFDIPEQTKVKAIDYRRCEGRISIPTAGIIIETLKSWESNG